MSSVRLIPVKLHEKIQALTQRSQWDGELIKLISHLQSELDRDEPQYTTIRNQLFAVRTRLYQLALNQEHAELCEQAKLAVHDALCYLTLIHPLNPKDEEGQYISSLSKKLIYPLFPMHHVLLLSNGYIYRLEEIEKGARKDYARQHFAQPPEGNLSAEDIAYIHEQGKSARNISWFIRSMVLAVASSALGIFGLKLLSTIFGVGLFHTAGLVAGLATLFTFLPIILPALVLIAGIAATYFVLKKYDEKYSAQAAPDATPALLSTAKTHLEMGSVPEAKQQDAQTMRTDVRQESETSVAANELDQQLEESAELQPVFVPRP